MFSRLIRFSAPVFFMILVAAMFLSCGKEKVVAKRSGVTHFPLVDGRIYEYRETRDGQVSTFTMRQRYVGGARYPVFDIYLKGTDWGDCSFILQDSSITFCTTKPRTMLELPGSIPEYRQTWLDEEISSGEFWDDPDTGTRTVVAKLHESVTVPAGPFDNCLKMVTESLPELFDSLTARYESSRLTKEQYDQQVADAKLVIQRWFAPGVGLIKEQIGSSDHIRELSAIIKDSRED